MKTRKFLFDGAIWILDIGLAIAVALLASGLFYGGSPWNAEFIFMVSFGLVLTAVRHYHSKIGE